MVIKKILYIDMDGVINLFEDDPDARTNMWNMKYFYNIEPREYIESDLIEISRYVDEIVILTKCIERSGVEEEKRKFIKKYLSNVSNLSIIFVTYSVSKREYINSENFTILLDDGIKNIKECEGKCNVAILFDEYNQYDYKNRVLNVKDIIKFLT